jgi:hypothetical protein
MRAAEPGPGSSEENEGQETGRVPHDTDTITKYEPRACHLANRNIRYVL